MHHSAAKKRALVALIILSLLVPAAAGQVSIGEGANDIAVSDDMAGQKLESFQGDCGSSIIMASLRGDGKWQPVFFPPFSIPIESSAVGKGLRVISVGKCTLSAKASAERLGTEAAKLKKGYNLISVTKSMADRSLSELPGCTFEAARLYSPIACSQPETETCSGDFEIIDLTRKLDQYALKGIWAKAADSCILDDEKRKIDLVGEFHIGVYDDLVGQSLQNFLSDECKSKVSFSVFDYERYGVPSDKASQGMEGLGLYVKSSASQGECKLTTKGYNEKLGSTALKLFGGIPGIRVIPNSMIETSKSFQDIKGTCEMTALFLAPQSDPKWTEKKAPVDFKFSSEYLGKPVTITSGNDCELETIQSAPASAPVPEKANLAPMLKLYKSDGTEITEGSTLKGGQTIKVELHVKNTGKAATKVTDLKDQGDPTVYNTVNFHKNAPGGGNIAEPVYSTINLVLPNDNIAAGQSLKTKEWQIQLPSDFTGKAVVAAAVDTQDDYIEENSDNKQTVTFNVVALKLPNLVPTTITQTITPATSTSEAVVTDITANVKNTGELPALPVYNGFEQFIEVTITVRKGDTAICKELSRRIVTVKPGEEEQFPVVPKAMGGNGPCKLPDATAAYGVIVEADTLKSGSVTGIVQEESEEDNLKSYVLGSATSKATAGQACSQDIDCESDLCVRKKCMSDAQREAILRISG
ncbi:hypothetical protein HYU18_02920 [Candidatus Woesearchaeota archaeon]|nr:hypothetical protein [Candidatus Woesearchaeota archaeon]